MNSHLKNFYPDDVLNESGGSGNKSATGDSLNINNSLTNSFSNSPGQSGALSTDSAEYDRKISLLTKKLRSYEKRRHKLVYESKQEQAASNSNQQQQQSQPQQQQQTQSTEQQQAENKVSITTTTKKQAK